MGDVVFEFVPEMLDGGAGRVDQGSAHRAEGDPVDALRQFQDQVDIARFASPVFNPVQDFEDALRTDPAGGAAPAGFVGEEFTQPAGGGDHAGGFVHHDDCPSAQFAAGLLQSLESHGGVDLMR